ncbi:MAG: ATP-binding protein [Proteobacteria bacterium]|nr:ATP-binding protein [Pseudomonadota bacterium]
MSIPVLLSWSGGKDSAWALHVMRGDARCEVVGLLTTITDGYERVAMHGIRRDVLHAQAAAAGLPLIEARLPRDADNARYEACFAAALEEARARWPELRHIAFGDLYLADVRAYRETLCARLDWQPVFPIWGAQGDTPALARQMIDAGLRATLCCIDTQQLDSEFAGRAFDADLLADLPAAVDCCGERGEFHTCVHAGSMFRAPLRLRRGETVLRDGRFAFVDLLLDD